MTGNKQAKINLMKKRIDQQSLLFQTLPTKCELEVIQLTPNAGIAVQSVKNASQLELLDTV